MTNIHRNIEEQDLYNSLIEEVKHKVHKLKEYGLSEKDIASLLRSEQPLLQLTVSNNYRIFLGEKRTEVCMEPLVKAVYLLFLKHPEGIMFKNLPDYREELTQIYAQLRPTGLTEKAVQSIEDVTNPLLNSINEKCARIRGAFIAQFDDSLAQHYYIYGLRGEPKKISLSRDLVTWE